MTAAHSYDEFLKILTRLHLLLHQPSLGVCAAVHVLLPLVVIQGNYLLWPEPEKKRQILRLQIFTFQMTGRQQPDMNYCLAMIQLVVSNIFLTIEMTMTGAGKMRQLFSFFTHLLSWWPNLEKCDKLLSSHFHFFGDRSGEKATTIYVHTFTF